MVQYEETGDAVKIVGATTTPEGIRAEYEYIAQKLGEQGRDWRPMGQSLSERDGAQFDAIEVELANGQKKTFLFDVSEFFGIEVEAGLIEVPKGKPRGCLGGLLHALLVGVVRAVSGPR